MPVVFAMRNRVFEDYNPRKPPVWAQVTRKGIRVQDTDGTITELFKVSVFGQALDRSVEVLKDWEKKGQLLPPRYMIAGQQCKRWYSAQQIINCHRIMIGRFGGRKYFHDSASFLRFVEDLKTVWYENDIVIDASGNRIDAKEAVNG